MEHPDDLAQLTDVLSRERQALLVGDLDEVEKLLPRKQDLFERVGAMPGSEAQMRDLARDISHNQTLLQSAMDGIRTVSARLREARAARAGLNLYDGQGRARHVDCPAGPSFEKRA